MEHLSFCRHFKVTSQFTKSTKTKFKLVLTNLYLKNLFKQKSSQCTIENISFTAAHMFVCYEMKIKTNCWTPVAAHA